jgi:hypothetical protein
MSVSPPGELDQVKQRNALIMEFITEVSRDLERLRAGRVHLDVPDSTSWRRLQTAAHNIGARAEGLKLGVLQLCARELEQFALEVLRPTDSDKSESIQGAMIALEMLDLELTALKKGLQPS